MKWLTPEEVGKAIGGKTAKYVRNGLIKGGKLPYCKVGGIYLVREDDLEAAK